MPFGWSQLRRAAYLFNQSTAARVRALPQEKSPGNRTPLKHVPHLPRRLCSHSSFLSQLFRTRKLKPCHESWWGHKCFPSSVFQRQQGYLHPTDRAWPSSDCRQEEHQPRLGRESVPGSCVLRLSKRQYDSCQNIRFVSTDFWLIIQKQKQKPNP